METLLQQIVKLLEEIKAQHEDWLATGLPLQHQWIEEQNEKQRQWYRQQIKGMTAEEVQESLEAIAPRGSGTFFDKEEEKLTPPAIVEKSTND